MTEADDQDRREVNDVVERRDEGAFRSLYERHTPALLGIAVRLVDSDEEAEDVVQQTWVSAVQNLAQFEWGSSLRTWLIGIVIDSCRARWSDALRSWKGRVVTPVADMPAADDQAVATASRIDLERALASLHPGYRALVLLHDVEGWTHPDMAKQLDLAEGLSKSQLVNARLAMRRHLAAQDTATPTDQ